MAVLALTLYNALYHNCCIVVNRSIWGEQTIQIWRCWPCLALVRPCARLEKLTGQPKRAMS